MSKKSKNHEKNQKKRRVRLREFYGEIVEYSGIVKDFGKSWDMGVSISGKEQVLLRKIKVGKEHVADHVWLAIEESDKEKFRLGETVLFFGEVYIYEYGRGKNIWKYGLNLVDSPAEKK